MQNSDENAQQISVMIVDDNDVIRRVLKGIIQQDPRLKCVGEATHGQSALECVRRTLPRVVCLDIEMPGLDGLAVLERIRNTFPHIGVVMITGYATSDTVSRAKALGAAGFVIKPFNAAKVLKAINGAAEGEVAQKGAAAA